MALTEPELLGKISSTWSRASSDWTLGYADWTLIGLAPTTWSAARTKINSMRNALRHLFDCVQHIHGYTFGEDSEGFKAISQYITDYWPPGAESEELTWEAIVTAWANASKTGRLYTVLTIDEMRKTVWQEEFTSFTLKAPGDD